MQQLQKVFVVAVFALLGIASAGSVSAAVMSTIVVASAIAPICWRPGEGSKVTSFMVGSPFSVTRARNPRGARGPGCAQSSGKSKIRPSPPHRSLRYLRMRANSVMTSDSQAPPNSR